MKTTVKEIKDIVSSLDNEDYFEFRLFLGNDCRHREIDVPLEIISYGSQLDEPPMKTNYIRVKEKKKEIKSQERLPSLYMFNGELIQLTRIVYEDGSVEYKENRLTPLFANY